MNGIWFDDVHSYDDLNLILSSPDIPPAQPKTTYIDIPGADGDVDLTEATGEVKFKNRECSFTFSVLPSDDFEVKKTQVSNLLNGKKCRIKLDKDPDYYWIGRCKVNSYSQDRRLRKIVVAATVEPYKFKLEKTLVEINLVNSVESVTLENDRKSVVPKITVSQSVTLTFGDVTTNLSEGTYELLDVQLREGENKVELSGTGSVIFEYQEGAL